MVAISCRRSYRSDWLSTAARTKGTTVKEDEQAIRKWFDDWMTATKKGDLELARSLIAEKCQQTLELYENWAFPN